MVKAKVVLVVNTTTWYANCGLLFLLFYEIIVGSEIFWFDFYAVITINSKLFITAGVAVKTG